MQAKYTKFGTGHQHFCVPRRIGTSTFVFALLLNLHYFTTSFYLNEVEVGNPSLGLSTADVIEEQEYKASTEKRLRVL